VRKSVERTGRGGRSSPPWWWEAISIRCCAIYFFPLFDSFYSALDLIPNTSNRTTWHDGVCASLGFYWIMPIRNSNNNGDPNCCFDWCWLLAVVVFFFFFERKNKWIFPDQKKLG
jgi:hypothetical protein